MSTRRRVLPDLSRRAPRITYVDVDQDAATLQRPAIDADRAQQILGAKIPTLMPVSVDATLERFVASPIEDDTDVDATLRMTTARELRVRSIGRRVLAATLAVGLAVLLVSTMRAAPPSQPPLVMGVEAARAPETTGEFVAPQLPADQAIFVDDVRVGAGPAALTVACGVRRIKLGDKGAVRMIDVPCGGRVTW